MKVDRFLGILALLLSIPVAFASWGFGVGSPGSPGAGFWPLLIALLMAGLGLVMLLRPAADAAEAAGASRWGRLSLCIASLLFYVATLEALGFLLATAILLLIQFRFVEGHRWRASVAFSLATAVASLVLFRVLLKVPLPAGIIPLPPGW